MKLGCVLLIGFLVFQVEARPLDEITVTTTVRKTGEKDSLFRVSRISNAPQFSVNLKSADGKALKSKVSSARILLLSSELRRILWEESATPLSNECEYFLTVQLREEAPGEVCGSDSAGRKIYRLMLEIATVQ